VRPPAPIGKYERTRLEMAAFFLLDMGIDNGEVDLIRYKDIPNDFRPLMERSAQIAEREAQAVARHQERYETWHRFPGRLRFAEDDSEDDWTFAATEAPTKAWSPDTRRRFTEFAGGNDEDHHTSHSESAGERRQQHIQNRASAPGKASPTTIRSSASRHSQRSSLVAQDHTSNKNREYGSSDTEDVLYSASNRRRRIHRHDGETSHDSRDGHGDEFVDAICCERHQDQDDGSCDGWSSPDSSIDAKPERRRYSHQSRGTSRHAR
jgi:hypothetical protein